MVLDVKSKASVVVSTTSDTKVIPNVLYILNISLNLLSIGHMLEKGYSLLFKDRKCTIFYSYKMNNKTFATN